MTSVEWQTAGLPALQGGEPGQVRKEAATAVYCKCRGLGSPLLALLHVLFYLVTTLYFFATIHAHSVIGYDLASSY